VLIASLSVGDPGWIDMRRPWCDALLLPIEGGDQVAEADAFDAGADDALCHQAGHSDPARIAALVRRHHAPPGSVCAKSSRSGAGRGARASGSTCWRAKMRCCSRWADRHRAGVAIGWALTTR
jgi:hypothetical protein